MKKLILFITLQMLSMVTTSMFTASLAIGQESLPQLNCRPNAKNICPQDRIIDQNDYVATVIQVLHSGNQALVKYDGFRGGHIVSLRDVSKAVSCVDSICQNDRVTNFLNDQGTVKEVFENKKIAVLLDRSTMPVIRKIDEVTLVTRTLSAVSRR